MDKGAWWATEHGVVKSQTQLKWLSPHSVLERRGEDKEIQRQKQGGKKRESGGGGGGGSRLFATPWTAACQASLSITNSRSLLKLMSIESGLPCNHFILCRPLLLLPSIFPSIRVFSNESVLHIRWPKYWSFSFSISPSNEHSGLISFRMDWLDLLAVQDLKSLLQHHSSKASILQCSAFFIV